MIGVLDTQIANASSVLYSLERLGFSAQMTQDPDTLSKCSHVILPGVGTAKALMSRIQSLEIRNCLLELKQPTLGICLGMQALYTFSEEGGVDCLGIFSGKVSQIQAPAGFSIPHMGWNQVKPCRDSRLLNGIEKDASFYFVHSFCVPSGSETSAYTDHGVSIPAVVERGNWFGTQFHPERSGVVGERLLLNFLNL